MFLRCAQAAGANSVHLSRQVRTAAQKARRMTRSNAEAIMLVCASIEKSLAESKLPAEKNLLRAEQQILEAQAVNALECLRHQAARLRVRKKPPAAAPPLPSEAPAAYATITPEEVREKLSSEEAYRTGFTEQRRLSATTAPGNADDEQFVEFFRQNEDLPRKALREQFRKKFMAHFLNMAFEQNPAQTPLVIYSNATQQLDAKFHVIGS
ncbi:hypothetical protein DIPPA_29329 [Diplonema papillatum]|nr:hypothetical protein DIPPA_29329 [Diplonema papillatum]